MPLGRLMVATILLGMTAVAGAQAIAAEDEPAEVRLRIRAWSDFEQGDGIYRVLFSEVTGQEWRMAPLVEAPPNAFEVAFLPAPADWPKREGDFYPFRFKVKPGRYAISFVFWASRVEGAETAVGQDITNRESLIFTVAAEGVTDLGDFRLRFDDMKGHATRAVRHLGHGREEGARAMRRATPEIGAITCPPGVLGASRRTCMKAAMDGQKYAAPRAAVE
mgnify:CR=1 FL=1